MITVEATGDVQPDLTVRIALPPTVTPGPHRLVLVIEDTPVAAESDRRPDGPLRLRKLRFPGWPSDATFRREDLYGDDGR